MATKVQGANQDMVKKVGFSMVAALVCAAAFGAHPGGLYMNEREFTNLTPAPWSLRLQACRAAGGMEVYSGDTRVASLGRPGAEIALPVQEGVAVRYLSLQDIRFTLVDRLGHDGGVVFQVGRNLELTPQGGDPAVLDRVLDLGRLRHGHVDLLEAEWPRP